MAFRVKLWHLALSGGFAIGTLALCISFLSVVKEVEAFDRPRVAFAIPKEKIKKVVLANGMTILVFSRPQVPKVVVQIAYDIGSGVEESGERGLAHLIEHMIFKGTNKLSEGDIDAIVRKYGASDNAYTSQDWTRYFFEVNKNNWKPFIGIMADCMQNARFNDQHLASEIKAVIQELRRGDDNHYHHLWETAFKTLYPANHPYHDPIIGYKEDLLLLSAERLHNFYHKYYHPHKATLFIVGDVDADEAIVVARSHFEKIPAAKPIPERVIPQTKTDISQQVNKNYRDIKQKLVAFYWEIPGLKNGNPALTSVVETVIGRGEGSLLYKKLVEEEQIATAAGALASQNKHSGMFLLWVEPKDGCTEICRKTLLQEVQKIIDTGVDASLITKAIRSNERKFISMLESNMALVDTWIPLFLATGDEYALFQRIDDYYAVNVAALRTFVKTNLDPFFANEMQLLPLPDDKKEQWLANKHRSEAIDQALMKKFARTEPLEEPKFVKTMPDPRPLKISFPQPDRVYELKNGLKVILQKSGDLPLVYARCSFRDGTFLGNTREGIALNATMSMLMERTAKYSKEENVHFFESFGAGYGFGSTGATLATVNVGYEQLFSRVLHILTQPRFRKNALKKVQAIFMSKYRQQKEWPSSIANNLLQTMVYKGHPYGWSIDAAIALVDDLSIDMLQSLHKKYVSPKNMVLVVSGDFQLDAMEKTIQNVFGSWHGGNRVSFRFGKGNFVANEQKDYTMLRDQVFLLFGQASAITRTHPDFVPLSVLNFIGFRPGGSRLWDVRERTGLFYAAGGGFAIGATKVHGMDHVWALVSLENLGLAEKALKTLIDSIAKTGVTEQELDAARQHYLKQLIDLIASHKTIAGTAAFLDEFNLGFDYYDKVLQRINRMTVAELGAIAKRYFSSRDFARVRVGRV